MRATLYPVIGLLERAAGLRREDPPERQLDKLEAMLALAIRDVRESAPLLADLLALPAAGRYPPLGLSPQQKKEKTFQVLLDQLAGLAAQGPVLALYEDVHWADPTMLELLGRAVERVQRLPALMLITFRPEFVPPWAGHGHVTAFSLSRLGRRQGGAMVERVTGPAEVLDQILARTDSHKGKIVARKRSSRSLRTYTEPSIVGPVTGTEIRPSPEGVKLTPNRPNPGPRRAGSLMTPLNGASGAGLTSRRLAVCCTTAHDQPSVASHPEHPG